MTSSYDIRKLKYQQDKFEARTTGLMAAFATFRDQVLDELDGFCQQAIEGGLKGVSSPVIEHSPSGVMASFSLKSAKYKLLTFNNAHAHRQHDWKLGVPILIYPDSGDAPAPILPLCGFTFVESRDRLQIEGDAPSKYEAHFIYFWKVRGGEFQCEWRETWNPPDAYHAVKHMIEWIYDLETYWVEIPPYNDLVMNNGRGAIGFDLERRSKSATK